MVRTVMSELLFKDATVLFVFTVINKAEDEDIEDDDATEDDDEAME